MKYLTYQRGKKKQAIGSLETNLSGIRVSLFFPDNQSLQRSRPHDQSEHHTDPQNHWCNLGHTHTNTPQQPIMERAGVVGKKSNRNYTEQQAEFKTRRDPTEELRCV